jgi:hypothetical protein
MFCPECKTEYRPGFTKCADCGTDLVARPPEQECEKTDEPTDAEENVLLWSGLTLQLYDVIREALDAAGISHKDVDREFGMSTVSREALLIWVNPRDLSAGRAIVQKILADSDVADRDDIRLAYEANRVNPFNLGRRVYSIEPEGRANPFGPTKTTLFSAEPERPREPTPDDIVQDFDPDDATAEVWSGEDKDMADYVKLCLGGVGIGCVLREDAAKVHVLVLPAQESRAREIVREIREGTPPQ